MAVIDIEPVLAQRRVQASRMLAEVPRQQLLRTQILELDVVLVRQPMPSVDDELKIFGKERPCVEPLPILIDLGGDAEFGFSLLQEFSNIPARAT